MRSGWFSGSTWTAVPTRSRLVRVAIELATRSEAEMTDRAGSPRRRARSAWAGYTTRGPCLAPARNLAYTSAGSSIQARSPERTEAKRVPGQGGAGRDSAADDPDPRVR